VAGAAHRGCIQIFARGEIASLESALGEFHDFIRAVSAAWSFRRGDVRWESALFVLREFI
jgi:hypothetical protein